jgi:hypothetical protein
LGAKSNIKIACANSGELKILPRLRDWELTSTAHTAEVPASVTVGTPDDTLELDLSHTKLPEGEYRLAAKWDWDPVEVKGSIDLRPFGDFAHARLSPDSEDRLVEGTGWVKVDLTGADFEFVNKITLVPPKDVVPFFNPVGAASKGGAASLAPPPLKGGPAPQDLTFALSGGAGGKEQTTLETEIDTSTWRAGLYSLKLTQTNGTAQDLGIVIHPANPVVSNLPLRANLGEQQQTLTLAGSGLERLDGLSSEGATWSLAPVPAGAQNLRERKATVKLSAQAKKGEQLELRMKVAGLHSPLESLEGVDVLGPRPKILRATASPSRAVDVALQPGEIAAGAAVSFALSTENAGTHPTIALTCENPNEVKRSLALRPGERDGSAELDFAGEGTLYLSLDPGLVGQSGCQLLAQASVEGTGASDPHLLGRVIRLPRIEKFLLTDEKDSGHLYLGSLTGQDLQTIEKTGWDAKTGYPVQGFPTPVAGDSQGQSLQIEMPWPPPMPRAPLYIWLRGESEGRITQAKY